MLMVELFPFTKSKFSKFLTCVAATISVYNCVQVVLFVYSYNSSRVMVFDKGVKVGAVTLRTHF